MGTLTIRVPDDTHERLRLLDKLEQAYAGKGAPHAAAQPKGRYRARKRPA